MKTNLKTLQEDKVKITNILERINAPKVTVEQLTKINEDFSGMLPELTSRLQGLINTWGSSGFIDKFVKDIYTERPISIHAEKRRCKLGYRGNAFLQTVVNNTMHLLRGKNPGIKSPNEALQIYGNKKFIPDSGFNLAEMDAMTQALISGDGFVEELETSKGNTRYISIEAAENMWVDWNYKEHKPIRYILQVDVLEGQILTGSGSDFWGGNLGKDVRTFQLYTPEGPQVIMGFEYPAERIIHYQFKTHIWGVYGRSPVASTINDLEILKEVERAIAVISRYKAVPKKVIMPEGMDGEAPATFDQTEIDKITKNLADSADFKNPVVGAQLKALDMGNGGTDINLMPYADYLKRKITITLNPEFITFGELVNYATSREQKQVLFLAISAMRVYFEPVSNRALFRGINKQFQNLMDQGVKLDINEFHYEYGEFAVELPEEKQVRVLNEWNNGIIQLNEARQNLGYAVIDGGGLFKWETNAATSPEQMLEAIKGIVMPEEFKAKK